MTAKDDNLDFDKPGRVDRDHLTESWEPDKKNDKNDQKEPSEGANKDDE